MIFGELTLLILILRTHKYLLRSRMPVDALVDQLVLGLDLLVARQLGRVVRIYLFPALTEAHVAGGSES